MADPLSVVAGVAGVATAGAGLACSLFRIADSLKSARDEINQFAEQVSSLSCIMEVAHGFLSSNQQLIAKVRGANKALNSMTRHNSNTIERVRATRKELRSLREDITIVARFRWLVKKHRVEQLKQEMGSAMSGMHLLMSSLTLAEVSTSHRADLEKIKRLTKQIKSLMKTVEVQKYRSENQHSLHNDVLRNEDDIQEELLNIAKEIVKETEEHFGSRPARAPSAIGTRSSRKRHRWIAAAPNTANIDSSSPSLPADSNPSQLWSGSSATPLSSKQPSSLLRNPSVDSDEADDPADQTNAENDEAKPQSIEVTSDTSVGPAGYKFDMENLRSAEAIPSYVNGQSTTVLLVPEFDKNFISINFAAAHGICVPPLPEGGKKSWIDFGNGTKEPIVGVVAVKWKQSARPGSLEFTVQCCVCQYSPKAVVFGRSFNQKRLEYSKR